MSSTEQPGPLRIGQVAELTGTTPRTIRYYEEIGLLPAAPERERGAHRLYEQADVERLQEVLRLKRLLGLSLDELRDLSVEEAARAARLREWHGGVEDPVRRREILDEGIRARSGKTPSPIAAERNRETAAAPAGSARPQTAEPATRAAARTPAGD
jgi:DNA-binding transcriptional MerR regulator